MVSALSWSLFLAILQPCWAMSSQYAFSAYPVMPGPGIKDSDYYKFERPIEKVAIIGAGVSGLIAYRELTHAGLKAHIFERDSVPGGNWHYTEETPAPAPIPNADVIIGDFTPSLPPTGVGLPYTEEYNDNAAQLKRDHRAPKPVWESLHSNAPAPLQQITEFPWPTGTNWELSHYQLGRYLKAFASYHGLNSNDDNPNISYNTRVERIDKSYDNFGREQGWTLLLKELVQTDSGSVKATWYQQTFDAVVVATGRYNAPYIPTIDGLAELAKVFPDRLMHSRSFRRPEPFANETILIVGAAVSGGEISRILNPWAKTIYQSIRPDNTTVDHMPLSDLLRRVPRNTTFVPEIKRFLPASPGSDFKDVQVELVNGTILTGIDHVIFGTGFRYSFPFLPQYHNSSCGVNDTAPPGLPQPLVTDGTHIRSLHAEVFYIEEPTLCFMDMNTGMQSFTFAEYNSVAFSKVWSGKAFLPSTQEMWRMYDEHVKERGGYSRFFQYLGPVRTNEYIGYFMAWLNDAAHKYGGRRVDGLPKGISEIQSYWTRARMADYFAGNYTPPIISNAVDPEGMFSPADLSEQELFEMEYNSMFNDWW